MILLDVDMFTCWETGFVHLEDSDILVEYKSAGMNH